MGPAGDTIKEVQHDRIREAKLGPFPQQVDQLSRFNWRLKREARELNLIVWESSRHRRGSAMEGKVRKDDTTWKKQLTQNQYYVTRQKGTEPPFTCEYEDTETPGTYRSRGCGQSLFRSENK